MNLAERARLKKKQKQLALLTAGSLCVVLSTVLVACNLSGAQIAAQQAPIPVSEFSRMIQEFSEPGGFFHSDVFTSNETSYLQVSGKLKEMGVSGGAYLGVAPEQNFTYIAKVRPSIAFIIDIRRQAIIQHLMYKALFHLAQNRAQFLALLFSRPMPPPELGKDESLQQLLDYISAAQGTSQAYRQNLANIRGAIVEGFRFPMTPEDLKSLEYVYNAFWRGNLRIGSRGASSANGYGYGGFPTLRDLVLETDLDGNRGNFLAHEADYQFVRKLQEQNRIIPVVGDFGGPKAIKAIANYLRKNGYTVSAFYTSNVEQFLFQENVFDQFADNVGALPTTEKSVLIRAVLRGYGGGYPGTIPGAMPGYRTATVLQKVSVFLDDYKAGRYPDYGSLISMHYIAPGDPPPAALHSR